MSTIGLDIIKGALKRINSYMPGETISSMDANDALESLNDLLDSLSTQENYIYGSLENILTFVPGQYQYTIGTGGNFNVPRPLVMAAAHALASGDAARFSRGGVSLVDAASALAVVVSSLDSKQFAAGYLIGTMLVAWVLCGDDCGDAPKGYAQALLPLVPSAAKAQLVSAPVVPRLAFRGGEVQIPMSMAGKRGSCMAAAWRLHGLHAPCHLFRLPPRLAGSKRALRALECAAPGWQPCAACACTRFASSQYPRPPRCS
jgi:hypothetical protein